MKKKKKNQYTKFYTTETGNFFLIREEDNKIIIKELLMICGLLPTLVGVTCKKITKEEAEKIAGCKIEQLEDCEEEQ